MEFFNYISKDVQRHIWQFLSNNDAVIAARVWKGWVSNAQYSTVLYCRDLNQIPTLPRSQYPLFRKICCFVEINKKFFYFNVNLRCETAKLNIFSYEMNPSLWITIPFVQTLIIDIICDTDSTSLCDLDITFDFRRNIRNVKLMNGNFTISDVGQNVEFLYFTNCDVRHKYVLSSFFQHSQKTDFENIHLKRLHLEKSKAQFSNNHCTELILDDKSSFVNLFLPQVSKIIFKFKRIQTLQFFQQLIKHFHLVEKFVLILQTKLDKQSQKNMKTIFFVLKKYYPKITFAYMNGNMLLQNLEAIF